jgi:hypothetical protein
MNGPELRRWEMNFFESEIATLMAITVAFNGVGLLAWRRGLVGRWYPIAIALSVLALMADPRRLLGVGSAGAVAAMLLGGFGLAVWVRHRKGDPWGRLRASSAPR